MCINEGPADRTIRVILGIVALFLGYFWNAIWAYIVGGILIITGAVGFCGLYWVFGISTLSKPKKEMPSKKEIKAAVKIEKKAPVKKPAKKKIAKKIVAKPVVKAPAKKKVVAKPVKRAPAKKAPIKKVSKKKVVKKK